MALVTTNMCDQKLIKEFSITDCECALWSVMTKIGPCYILGIYRPPQTSIPIFIDELTNILELLKVQYTNIVVLGDFNIHIHDYTDNDCVLFLSTMEALGFDQHIQKPTHVRGNTLDLIFTSTSNKLEIAEVDVGTFISDHARVSVLFTTAKQRPHKTTIEKRESKNLTSIEVMQEFNPLNINLKGDLNHTHDQFNDELQRVVDKLAPISKKTIFQRIGKQQLTNEIHTQWHIMRRRESIWKCYRQHHHWQAYARERNRFNRMLHYHKTNKICGEILNVKDNTRSLYKVVNRLTGKKDMNPLPAGQSDAQLADDFLLHSSMRENPENP